MTITEEFMNGLEGEIRKRLFPGYHIGISNSWRITITQYSHERVCHPTIAAIYFQNGILRTYNREYLIADPKFTIAKFIEEFFYDMQISVPVEATMME